MNYLDESYDKALKENIELRGELTAALEREKVLEELVEVAPSLIEDVISYADFEYPIECRQKYKSYRMKYNNAIRDAMRAREIIARVKAMREGK